MKSPLSPILEDIETLPEAFKIQFLHSPELDYDVVLEGVLTEVWFRPIWLAPLFWLLERLGILIAERANSIKTTLKVVAIYDENGFPYHLWFRRFYGAKVKKFDVKVIFDRASKQAVDLVGLKGFLALAWDVRFAPPDTIKLDVVGAGIRYRDRIFWLPNWLWPIFLGREEFIQKVDFPKADQVSIHLLIKHPLFGSVFSYKGTFQVTQHKEKND
ncbi:DUF4166 domain-containing protein [Candidatus Leptofilum sp.]|uniref:DUF4166 domain-containing protein n=1 Tax=Candidatus Leptofilum sp. TaxID=3241576 RepID=UPI003B5D0200